jgi:hypothetical protein
MAKAKTQDDVNKSAAIRDELKQNPALSTQEVVDSLAKKGVTVTPGLVYQVRTAMKAKEKKQRREAAKSQVNGKKTQGATAKDAVQVVKKIKGLASELGGLGNLKEVVDALAD